MATIRKNQKVLLDFIEQNEATTQGVSINFILEHLTGAGGQGQTSSRRTNINKTLVHLVEQGLLSRNRVLDKETGISQFTYSLIKRDDN